MVLAGFVISFKIGMQGTLHKACYCKMTEKMVNFNRNTCDKIKVFLIDRRIRKEYKVHYEREDKG